MTYDATIIKKAAADANLYNSRYAKYFLLRLEIINSEHDVYKEINAKSIEHVFPQNPSATSDWAKDPDFSEHKSVVNSIGNLVLLSKSKNSSASNHDFPVKKNTVS
ncbi:HNH endonuclease family protein [Pseudoduganella sp. UC29_106]|uniref:HNH endonuclease family protein n=1 Tax=Pseudoduganella sp. UC29_106 TaxID=3374553 RepID=UPI0037573A4D